MPYRHLTCASVRHKAALGVCLIVVLSGAAGASSKPQDELASDQMSVRELMQLDTALALSQARSVLQGVGKPSHSQAAVHKGLPVPVSKEGPKLIAIYGVGKKLLAEVSVGSQPLLYMRGHPLPVGLKAGASALHLRDMTSTCVYLERQEESHTLCLHPRLVAGD